MIEELRTERTFGVTAQLKPRQRMHLATFQDSEVYDDVLDVLEMVCIEIEAKLINTEAENEAAVLANHKLTKAAWNMFIHFQQKIQEEAKRHHDAVAPKPPIPRLTPEEEEREVLLNPTYIPREYEETGI